MRKLELEAKVIEIVNRAQNGQPTEDDYVELKAKWPTPPEKIARQLAGSLNAARGEPVLWLIGVEEKTGIVQGVNYQDMPSWWDKVKAEFDGEVPLMVFKNVSINGTTVVALHFESRPLPML